MHAPRTATAEQASSSRGRDAAAPSPLHAELSARDLASPSLCILDRLAVGESGLGGPRPRVRSAPAGAEPRRAPAPAPVSPWQLSQLALHAPGETPQPPGPARPRLAALPATPLSFLQAKLAIAPAHDPLEQEADRIADRLVASSAAQRIASAGPLQVSRTCSACEAEEDGTLRRASASGTGAGATSAVASPAPALVHQALRSPAQPLDAGTRAFFEPRLGHDLARVRIHHDQGAAASARAVQALAYTVGQDIVFGDGQFAPATAAGRRLLAHELVHVVQQGAGAQRLHRTPCRPASQCGGDNPGDTGQFSERVRAKQAAKAAALAHAPPGSVDAALAARHGQRATNIEALLASNSVAIPAEVFGFFINPAIGSSAGAQNNRCSSFPAPGIAGAPANKNCVQVPAQLEDLAATLAAAGASATPRQHHQLVTLLMVATHEMQHATFNETQAASVTPAADCNLATTVMTGASGIAYPISFYLSELSAITAEFQPFFKDRAANAGAAANNALDKEEQEEAVHPDESALGIIRGMQCVCSCDTVDSFVTQTVNLATASWPADQKKEFLRSMTVRIPFFWPRALRPP